MLNNHCPTCGVWWQGDSGSYCPKCNPKSQTNKVGEGWIDFEEKMNNCNKCADCRNYQSDNPNVTTVDIPPTPCQKYKVGDRFLCKDKTIVEIARDRISSEYFLQP